MRDDRTSPAADTTMSGRQTPVPELPSNRFELELEFVQFLASPAYLHFLSTQRNSNGGLIVQDPRFLSYLTYLRDTWSRPEYSRLLTYPHALYFLNLILEKPDIVWKEFSLPSYRNFVHQQQFLSWQHRHENLYGVGSNEEEISPEAKEDRITPLARST